MSTNGISFGFEFETLQDEWSLPLESIFNLDFLTSNQQELRTSQLLSFSNSNPASSVKMEASTPTEEENELQSDIATDSDFTPSSPEVSSPTPRQTKRQRKQAKRSTVIEEEIPSTEEKIQKVQEEIASLKKEHEAIALNLEFTREQRRLEKNRLSACLSRRNKELGRLTAQQQFEALQQENAALRRENATLKQENTSLKEECGLLLQRLQTVEQDAHVSVTIPETTLLFHYQPSSSPKTSPVKREAKKRSRPVL